MAESMSSLIWHQLLNRGLRWNIFWLSPESSSPIVRGARKSFDVTLRSPTVWPSIEWVMKTDGLCQRRERIRRIQLSGGFSVAGAGPYQTDPSGTGAEPGSEK